MLGFFTCIDAIYFYFFYLHIPDVCTAPIGCHSTPTPPNYLPLEEVVLRANHDVQRVEVELVTPPPAAPGTSPKTGIIRCTLKYSETDLDAVPLRCYWETDIDEVLLADKDDSDSAFGSNRSVMGTSGTGSSPLGETAYKRTDGEEDEEEDVASWASVRTQCDIRRQQATQEQKEEEILTMLFKRCHEIFIYYLSLCEHIKTVLTAKCTIIKIIQYDCFLFFSGLF